jgi:hypothetical protein
VAEQPCLPQVQACIIRVAHLGPDGVPLVGVTEGYISDALVSVAFEPEYQDGAEVTQDNACGDRIVDYKAPDIFRWGNVTIQLATPDPYLAAFLSGGTTIVGSGPDIDRIGWAAPPLGTLDENPISMELWAKRPDKATGSLDAASPYARWAYPLVKNLRLGSWTHENGPILPEFTGQAFENPSWGNGPWDDWLVSSDRVVQWFPVAAADLPDATCAPVPVAVQVP